MRVFVLSSGRSGTTTFAKACSHITNFSTAHESGRFVDWSYPDGHIEVDNRLSWQTGNLFFRYNAEVAFVLLSRRRDHVIASFARRYREFRDGIIRAYHMGILAADYQEKSRLMTYEQVAEHFIEALTFNLRLFFIAVALERRDAPMPHVALETISDDFPFFWNAIGAKGDLEAAMSEFDTRYNEA